MNVDGALERIWGHFQSRTESLVPRARTGRLLGENRRRDQSGEELFLQAEKIEHLQDETEPSGVNK